jgi:hypothetical protein
MTGNTVVLCRSCNGREGGKRTPHRKSWLAKHLLGSHEQSSHGKRGGRASDDELLSAADKELKLSERARKAGNIRDSKVHFKRSMEALETWEQRTADPSRHSRDEHTLARSIAYQLAGRINSLMNWGHTGGGMRVGQGDLVYAKSFVRKHLNHDQSTHGHRGGSVSHDPDDPFAVPTGGGFGRPKGLSERLKGRAPTEEEWQRHSQLLQRGEHTEVFNPGEDPAQIQSRSAFVTRDSQTNTTMVTGYSQRRIHNDILTDDEVVARYTDTSMFGLGAEYMRFGGSRAQRRRAPRRGSPTRPTAGPTPEYRIGKSWFTKHYGTGHDQLSHGNRGGAALGATKESQSEDATPDTSSPIKVGDNIALAIELLSQGKRVELAQPRQVSTLLTELAAQVDAAAKAGEKAPEVNLCNVSVPGTNVFCGENMGLARIEMPQLKGNPEEGSRAATELLIDERGEADVTMQFVEHLSNKGYALTKASERTSYLRSTQAELNGGQVGGMLNHLRKGGNLGNSPTIVSRDNYILDGHHRWAANVAHDAIDNRLGDVNVPIYRLDIDIGTLLHEAHSFADAWGIKRKSVKKWFRA